LLETIRLREKPVRLYNASSSECFGDTGDTPANEETPFRPRSPYAVAKASAHWLVSNYREAYKLYACNGILFNHESPLRAPRFVTQKIVQVAKRIAQGSDERLLLGRLDILRDWGWAPEYIEAMWKMLQQDKSQDFVIATGKSNTLADFVRTAFEQNGLDWRSHVDVSPALYRPADIDRSFANPSKARTVLGWRARFGMSDIVEHMSKRD
jgi:GDPmannose 4,6-dehydratase